MKRVFESRVVTLHSSSYFELLAGEALSSTVEDDTIVLHPERLALFARHFNAAWLYLEFAFTFSDLGRLTDMSVTFDVRQLGTRCTLHGTVSVLTVLGLPHVVCLLPDLLT